MGRFRDERAQQDLEDLLVAVDKCRALLPVLSALLVVQPGIGPRTGTIGRHAPESKEPWSPEVATAYWAIFFGSQFLANEMRMDLGLGRVTFGKQDGLDVVASCASIVTLPLLRRALTLAQRWHLDALKIRDIDEADVWIPVPRAPDSKPPECPYCRTMSLRLNRQRGEIRCTFPGCVDSSGNATRARMEYDPATGQGILVFSDDMTLTFRHAA